MPAPFWTRNLISRLLTPVPKAQIESLVEELMHLCSLKRNFTKEIPTSKSKSFQKNKQKFHTMKHFTLSLTNHYSMQSLNQK